MKFSKVADYTLSFFKNKVQPVLAKVPPFVAENFEIKSTKRSRIFGIIVLFLSLLWVILCVNAFISQQFTTKWILLAFALSCPFILGLVTAYTVIIKHDLINKIWHFAFLFIMPVIIMTMTECLNNVFIYNMTYLGFIGNYFVILIMLFIFFAFTGSLKTSYKFISSVLFGFGVAHSYIMDFRGTPFLPMDFLSISTAVGIANTYNYAPTYKIVTGVLLFVFILIISIKTKTPKYRFLTKLISRTFTFTSSAVLLLIFYFTNFFTNLGVKPDFWNQARGYRNYGFVFSYFANTKYLYMTEPEAYNPDNIKDYVDNVIPGDKKNDNVENYTRPNIICIMNESLSDLKVLGNLTTNEDYMPFIRSLTKNTIKGNLYVPVIGAGTSNTEFEFLTGHTTAFLPSGSNAYMLYVKTHIASLVSTLEAQGYSSFALHPYYAIGWKRTEVYKNFGFDRFVTLEDIIDISLMRQFQESGNDANYLQQLIEENYPGENMLVRQYISDSYNYKLLIEDFENRDKSIPYFAFNVTMQNHGGYTTSCVNFEPKIYATSTSKPYIKANNYLSLMKYSDDAFKELIEYFSKVKEPTIICMFGDHQPSVETGFIAEVMGVGNLSNLTPEQEQSRRCTPF
ncbi:MAG: LTA synthase family protein, partial [Acutalibacteraceae bacterium]